MNKRELWHSIKYYHFEHIVPPHFWDKVKQTFGGDNASTKAFAHKISKKHHWEFEFAMKAIFEYKKFVYLGVISDFVVTPSKIIDVVWHEHLLFTEAYKAFCEEKIMYAFNHYPELLTDERQTIKFEQQFKRTLELYKSEFGIDPPNSIWGLAKFEKRKGLNRERLNGDGIIVYYGDSEPLYNHFNYEMESSSGYPEFTDSESFDGGGATGSWSESDSSDSDGDGGGCSGGCGGD